MKYIPAFKLEAVISLREDLSKDAMTAEAVKILLESRFSRFAIAGFRIEEVQVH